ERAAGAESMNATSDGPRARNWTAIGAASGALAVILGAFGAHALKTRVSAEDLEIWKTAVLYHALHALALVLYGLFAERRDAGRSVGCAFVAGSAIFSGTLYAIVLGAPRALGMVTPLGGLALIGAWIGFALQASRKRTRGGDAA